MLDVMKRAGVVDVANDEGRTRGAGLTRKQLEVLRAVEAYLSDHGHGPTLREMCVLTGRSSVGSMHRMIRRIEQAGHIRLGANRSWRTIMTTGICPCCGQQLK